MTLGGPGSPARNALDLDSLGPRYARLVSYLGNLPAGLASYPECRARRGVVDAVFSVQPRFEEPPPPLVGGLLTIPRAPWIPEVHFQAGILAMADRAGWSESETLAWHRSLNRNLFRGPVFRAVMAFLSPLHLLERGAARWNTFHDGTSLSARAAGPRAADAVLSFPARLFELLHLRVYGEAFAAALEHARAGRVVVELVDVGGTSARYLARW
ncbi:MAG TPA: hypothetical protein VFG59_16610 [Anaeromyxobacter sp.]|nr:hypothetical protein [Anaeromyxobacter sp.]